MIVDWSAGHHGTGLNESRSRTPFYIGETEDRPIGFYEGIINHHEFSII